jgi:hypothetical protein
VSISFLFPSMGLAYPALSSSGVTTVPFTQYDQGKAQGLFGLRLSMTPNYSSLTFGGWNTARFRGYFSYYPVGKTSGSSSRTYWQIAASESLPSPAFHPSESDAPPGSPYVNRVAVLSPRVNHIFDSGTTLIVVRVLSCHPAHSQSSPVAFFRRLPLTVRRSFGLPYPVRRNMTRTFGPSQVSFPLLKCRDEADYPAISAALWLCPEGLVRLREQEQAMGYHIQQ